VKFEFWQAVLAGLITGAVMEGPVYLQKPLGRDLKQNIFRTWGRIERVEPFLWEGHGGDLPGFFLLRADLAQRNTLRYSGDCPRLVWGSSPRSRGRASRNG